MPALSAPQVAGVHIGKQGLEPDGTLVEDAHSNRSQKSLVACHLYSTEYASTHLGKVPRQASQEERRRDKP